MILYFTGTGNSKFAADVLADRLGEKTVSLNQVLKNQEPLEFQSERPFVFVAPIYAWRYPKVIEELIERAEYKGNKLIYFVGTCGDEAGRAGEYLQKICEKKRLKYKGFSRVVMPSNYLIAQMSKPEENRKILKRAIPVLEGIADSISQETNLRGVSHTPKAGLKSGIVNKAFNRFICNSKDYLVSDQCIGCESCVSWCPVNNITIVEGRPTFGDHCVNCYACMQRCPQEAINIKGKTEGHRRYVCPEYKRGK